MKGRPTQTSCERVEHRLQRWCDRAVYFCAEDRHRKVLYLSVGLPCAPIPTRPPPQTLGHMDDGLGYTGQWETSICRVGQLSILANWQDSCPESSSDTKNSGWWLADDSNMHGAVVHVWWPSWLGSVGGGRGRNRRLRTVWINSRMRSGRECPHSRQARGSAIETVL